MNPIKTPTDVTQKPNYAFVNLGKREDLEQFSFFNPARGKEVDGKIFLKEILGLTGMEVSMNKLPANAAMPFWHRHQQNEELYIFLGGTGEFHVDDDVLSIKEGSIIRLKPSARRIFRNTSTTEDLYFIVIQAKENSLQQYTFTDGEGVDTPLPW
jgi:mannose-6-phosphate isomerase-like protein (cupin superfamily)